MIKGVDNKRLTPKQKAQEIIGDKLGTVFYWSDWDDEYEAMTQREVDEINRQLEILVERLRKQGFDYKYSADRGWR